MSIQTFNRREKPRATAIGLSAAVVNYKQNKYKADVFAMKNKCDKINH